MDTSQWNDLLSLLKALGDKQRLTMVGMMGEGERTVREMAAQLDLSEPTVSHHVSKLHRNGLLHLRMDGNQRFYRVNKKRVKALQAYVAEIDTPPEAPDIEDVDDSWIHELNWSKADKKVLLTYTANGRLVQFPAKEKKLLVVLRWLATQFEYDRTYTEKDVNAILSTIHEDYATLRRSLVEYGFMRREIGGGDYWRTPES